MVNLDQISLVDTCEDKEGKKVVSLYFAGNDASDYEHFSGADAERLLVKLANICEMLPTPKQEQVDCPRCNAYMSYIEDGKAVRCSSCGYVLARIG